MIEEYEGVYSPSTLHWVFTIKYILCGVLSKYVRVFWINCYDGSLETCTMSDIAAFSEILKCT